MCSLVLANEQSYLRILCKSSANKCQFAPSEEKNTEVLRELKVVLKVDLAVSSSLWQVVAQVHFLCFTIVSEHENLRMHGFCNKNCKTTSPGLLTITTGGQPLWLKPYLC